MTVEIQAVNSSPVGGIMEVRAFAISHGASTDGRVFLTGDCVTHKEFCREVDSLIQQLESSNEQAKIKFDEVAKN